MAELGTAASTPGTQTCFADIHFAIVDTEGKELSVVDKPNTPIACASAGAINPSYTLLKSDDATQCVFQGTIKIRDSNNSISTRLETRTAQNIPCSTILGIDPVSIAGTTIEGIRQDAQAPIASSTALLNRISSTTNGILVAGHAGPFLRLGEGSLRYPYTEFLIALTYADPAHSMLNRDRAPKKTGELSETTTGPEYYPTLDFKMIGAEDALNVGMGLMIHRDIALTMMRDKTETMRTQPWVTLGGGLRVWPQLDGEWGDKIGAQYAVSVSATSQDKSLRGTVAVTGDTMLFPEASSLSKTWGIHAELMGDLARVGIGNAFPYVRLSCRASEMPSTQSGDASHASLSYYCGAQFGLEMSSTNAAAFVKAATTAAGAL